jgi:hypothetical protein
MKPRDRLRQSPRLLFADVTRGRVVQRELDVGPEIDMTEPREQLGRAARFEPRTSVDDEVVLQAGRLELRPLDRKRDAWIAGDILQFPLVETEMPGNDLVPVQSDPEAG